jgi:hypothetical protein
VELNDFMVRYIVNDIDAAITFYTPHLQFRVAGNRARTSRSLSGKAFNSY